MNSSIFFSCLVSTDIFCLIIGEFLSQRSWRGLEPKLGQTEVKAASKGRRGIAIAYEGEPEQL